VGVEVLLCIGILWNSGCRNSVLYPLYPERTARTSFAFFSIVTSQLECKPQGYDVETAN